MKLSQIVLYLFVFNFFLSVEAQDSLNQLDDKGQKHGPWIGYYDDTKHLKYEGVFSHGKEVGVFVFYDNTKAKNVIARRVFNENDNSVLTTFYNGKFKVSEGKIINRLYEGAWNYYHFNSDTVMTLEFYEKGKLEGARKVFYKNGAIAEIAHYKNGIKDGAYFKYAENGVILEEMNYKDGEFHGKAIFRNADHKLIAEGQYTMGKPSGIWKYYKNGLFDYEENKSIVKKPKK